MEFEIENDEVSIEMETGNRYKFLRSIENDSEVNDYKFEYEIGGVEGEVKVTFDNQGDKTSRHHINEDSEEKDIEIDEDD